MKTLMGILGLVLCPLALSQSIPEKAVRLDESWLFHRGGAQYAEQPAFDDSEWQVVDLPHDWSLDDLPGTTSPFDRDAISQVSGGFTTGGTGWYRKRLNLPDSLRGKTIFLLFEGIYMNAVLWLNRKPLAPHPYGYTSFYLNITQEVRWDGDNILAVKVMNEGENSRWYSGSGIYRHVWLIVDDPVHLAFWGTEITTPKVTADSARILVRTEVINEYRDTSRIRLFTYITDPIGNRVAGSFAEPPSSPGEHLDFTQSFRVTRPDRWSPDHPALYTVHWILYRRNQPCDSDKTTFGVRSIVFNAEQGFVLNGQLLKLQGGCIHHDNGPLGARAYDRAEERKIELLRASGFNAIRCAHNPPSPALLDACDRLGMMVIDEAFDMWEDEKNPYDYHLYFNNWWQRDVESMVKRDRNHPSVILWSIGNEIPNRKDPKVIRTADTLVAYIHHLDPTRPVTAAVNNLGDQQDPYFNALDLAGYNYAAGGDHGQSNIYQSDHQRVPERIMVGTESYPLEAFQSWMDVKEDPWVIGDFVWTAFDYLGEASIGWRGYWQEQNFFPWNLAYCGDLDICGWKRPQSYYRDALWKENQLSLFVTPPRPSFAPNPARQPWSKWHWYDAIQSWNWPGYEDRPLEVTVYSSCDRVELFLNGKSLGSKTTDKNDRYMASWSVPYRSGILKATGYKGKKLITTALLKTAGKPAKIILTSDRSILKADKEDLAYVTVELTDNEGNCNPDAENLVNFEISGPGTLVGVGNANPVSLESDHMPQRTTWRGRCLAIIKSGNQPGDITFRATVEGMAPAEIKIAVKNEQLKTKN